LSSIVKHISALASDAGLSIEHHQNNSESELINIIHAASKKGAKYIIINPAAFTHTSVAVIKVKSYKKANFTINLMNVSQF
jgi:3-dehydroquinate dehydratase-2